MAFCITIKCLSSCWNIRRQSNLRLFQKRVVRTKFDIYVFIFNYILLTLVIVTGITYTLRITFKIITFCFTITLFPPVICEGWHTALAWQYHFTKSGGLGLYIFYWNALPSHGSELSCICLIGLASFSDFYIGFWNCPDSVIFIVFHFVHILYSLENFIFSCSNSAILIMKSTFQTVNRILGEQTAGSLDR